MLKRLQDAYSGKPVRFLLVPCNQFSAQEPGSNAAIKAFAEKSVRLGPGSNVLMLAKSNLNGVACQFRGPGACTPASTECCYENDPVYDFLLARTPPGTIKWNFDKIVVGTDGAPVSGEPILHGEALDATLGGIIDQFLPASDRRRAAAAEAAAEEPGGGVAHASRAGGLQVLAAAGLVGGAGAFVASVFLAQAKGLESVEDASAGYHLAA